MKPKRSDLEKAVAALAKAITDFVCPVCKGAGLTTRKPINCEPVRTHCECCWELKESARRVVSGRTIN